MNVVFLFTILLSIPALSLFADVWSIQDWEVAGGVEVGVVISSDAGTSQTFPATQTDEFYRYDPHYKNQSKVIYGAFLGVIYRELLCNWDLQLDAKYSQADSFRVHGTLTQGLDVVSQDVYNYKYKITIRQLLGEAKLSYTGFTQFRPYALVGLGAGFNSANSFSTTVPDLLTFTRVYKGRTLTSFSYAVGAGIDVEVTNCLYLGISYRFADFGKVSFGSASIDGIPVSGTLSQGSFYANQVLAQLTFLF